MKRRPAVTIPARSQRGKTFLQPSPIAQPPQVPAAQRSWIVASPGPTAVVVENGIASTLLSFHGTERRCYVTIYDREIGEAECRKVSLDRVYGLVARAIAEDYVHCVWGVCDPEYVQAICNLLPPLFPGAILLERDICEVVERFSANTKRSAA